MAQSKTNIWIDGSQAGGTLKALKAEVRQLNNEINQLPIGSEKYNSKLNELKGKQSLLNNHRNDIRGIGDSYGTAQKGIGGMIKQFAPMAGAIGIVTGVVGGVVSGFKDWVQTNMQMEKSLSSLKALTGASAEDIIFYKEQATQLGKTTTLSATQVVDAYKLIGSAKPELLGNKEALNAVTKETITLAEAAEMELGGAAQSLTGMTNQFNLDASQSSRIINVLAAGSKEGASDITSLSDSIDKSGAVMNGYNISIEEGVALLETLGEKNIKGAEAGTQLRNVLLTMQGIEALPQKALDALEQYGVNTKLVADETVPFQERLQEMSKVSGDATAMIQVFGKENIVAGTAILGNVDKVGKLTDAVTGTQTAYEQASINTDNLDGDLKSLSSAWEGVMLSMDGGGDIFRPIVQAGADMLNWVSDSIVAFKNWDTNAMETQVLKLAKAFTFFNPTLEEYFDHQIKINDISAEVVAAVKDESEAVAVAIKTIDANNQKMKQSNLTEKESAELKQQNAEFIDALNKKYPELTSQIDLNKASSKELALIQKEINANLLEQALNAAMAREAERLLDEIVQQTIEVSTKRREEQEMMRDGNLSIAESFSVLMNGSSAETEVARQKNEKALKNLGGLKGEIEKNLKGIDLNYGAGVDENTKVAKTALKELDKLTKQLANEQGPNQRKILEASIKAQQTILSTSNKYLNEQQQKSLALLNEKTESEKAATVAAEQAAERSKEAYKAAQSELKKLREELESLKKNYDSLQEDFDYNKKLNAFKEGLEKELFELEKSNSDKYEADIEVLELLAQKKGSIGVQAQEQLNALLALKVENFEYEKQRIEEKFRKEKESADSEAQKQSNLLYLKQQETLEKSIVDLKVAEATVGVQAASKATLAEQKNAAEAMKAALLSQLDNQHQARQNALLDQYGSDEISHAEFLNRKKILDAEYAAESEEISEASSEKINQMSMDRVMSIGSTVQQAISAFSELSDAQYEKRQKSLDKEQDAELLRIETAYANREINEEEYAVQKLAIENETNEKKNALANEQAAKQKKAAKAQAVIGAALAIVQAFAQLGPIGGAIAALLVGVTTLAQISAIDNAEVEQFADGGFANVIGAKDGKHYRARNIGRHPGGMTPTSPSLMLASERGPEYFVPNHLLQHPRVLDNVRVIEAIRTNQYADGGFTTTDVPSGGSNSEDAQIQKALISVLTELSSKLPYIRAVIDDQQIDNLMQRGAEIEALKS